MERARTVDEVDRDGRAGVDHDHRLLEHRERRRRAQQAVLADDGLGVELAADGHRHVAASIRRKVARIRPSSWPTSRSLTGRLVVESTAA